MTPLTIPGIQNGYKVDAAVWRGAQPSDDAWALLAAGGCKAVLDLNTVGLDEMSRQRELCYKAGLAYRAMRWSGIIPPCQMQIRSALAWIDIQIGGGGAPVYVHCLHGSDRTGALLACWRMHHDGWLLPDAMEEALIGLGWQGLHEPQMLASIAHYAHELSEHKCGS